MMRQINSTSFAESAIALKTRVTIIIPCRNEEKHIGKVMENIQQQDYSKALLELIIVDGLSTDRTLEIAKQKSDSCIDTKIISNEKKFVSQGLNLGIKASTGDIIIRMDAHAEYPNDYVSKLVYYLYDLQADNVGGICVTLPGDNTIVALAIAQAISCSFGIGNAQFRLKPEKIIAVDTVPFGCFRREIFDQIGLFDEDLIRNQDDELNVRILKNKGKIFLIPDIQIKYFGRNTLGKLHKMYFQYGLFKPLVIQKTRTIVTLRQIVPVLFLSYLLLLFPVCFFYRSISVYFIAPLMLYVLLSIYYTIKNISNTRKIGLAILPAVFLLIHVSYGLGYFIGIFKYLLKNIFNIRIKEYIQHKD